MKPNYRCCISCRQLAPKETLIRVVRVHPSYAVQLDRGMGRSAYICPQKTCIRQAFSKQRLARSLRTKVSQSSSQNLQERLLDRVSSQESKNLKSDGNLPGI
ncbi:YlxR family protein [Myxosarcina sp. GI1]|uniref:YlxR family protein n=1 Tax=Myxosarcina sp. GI1 TaxID=1541065 RepID=UPI00055EF779|nr:YlxR family protein [Myxosarcina sp. GI1]